MWRANDVFESAAWNSADGDLWNEDVASGCAFAAEVRELRFDLVCFCVICIAARDLRVLKNLF